MLENYGSKIPEKAKELVMMLGKSRDEEGKCIYYVITLASVSIYLCNHFYSGVIMMHNSSVDGYFKWNDIQES